MTTLLRWRRLLAVVVVMLVAVTVGTLLTVQRSDKTVTAYFSQAPGLYAGDPVRVLGVDIGKVVSIKPQPGRVRVVLSYDPTLRVPAEAKAAIVAPTLVSGRFVQLSPAYVGGRALPDDATLPMSRTAVPVEWNTTVTQLTKLAKQLGPGAGEVTGALGRALDTTDRNLNGQGYKVHDTIREVSSAMTALASGGEDLFGTVRNLQSLVTNLGQNDAAVKAFSQQLTRVSSVLATNRDQLGTVFRTLDQSAGLIRNFVRDNRDQLSNRVRDVSKVAKQLADNRQALGDLLQRAPVGVSNFINIYDPVYSLMTGAFALNMFTDPATFSCSLIFQAGGQNDNTNRMCETAIAPFVKVLKMNNVPLLTNPLEIAPKSGKQGGSRSGGGR